MKLGSIHFVTLHILFYKHNSICRLRLQKEKEKKKKNEPTYSFLDPDVMFIQCLLLLFIISRRFAMLKNSNENLRGLYKNHFRSIAKR